jgi:hypothetical protein
MPAKVTITPNPCSHSPRFRSLTVEVEFPDHVVSFFAHCRLYPSQPGGYVQYTWYTVRFLDDDSHETVEIPVADHADPVREVEAFMRSYVAERMMEVSILAADAADQLDAVLA